MDGAFNANNWTDDPGVPERAALGWLERNSLPLARLASSDVIRGALNACARKLDGKPAAATVVNRKRAVLYNALGYAVERGLLEYNPIDKIQWRAPALAEQVDRRVVANTRQVESILSVLPSVDRHGDHLVAFFGWLYFGGLRPSEAASLRLDDCVLPDEGWGAVSLAETSPHAGAGWTDDGGTRETRGLKHRAENDVRHVPIPPDLVRLLRAPWIASARPRMADSSEQLAAATWPP